AGADQRESYSYDAPAVPCTTAEASVRPHRVTEKIEVATVVRLQDALPEQVRVPSCGHSRISTHGLSLQSPSGHFLVAQVNLQKALVHVQTDEISGLHQREWPTDRRFRSDVQHDGAEGRPAHASIRDAYHIC